MVKVYFNLTRIERVFGQHIAHSINWLTYSGTNGTTNCMCQFVSLLLVSLKQSFSTRRSMTLKTKYKEPFSMDYRERGSHARGTYVYPTQYTSRMGVERVKQEEETDTKIMRESSKKSGRKERGHVGEKSPNKA